MGMDRTEDMTESLESSQTHPDSHFVENLN